MAITTTHPTTGETVTITRDSTGQSVRVTYADGRKTWEDYLYMAEVTRTSGIILTREQFDALGEEYAATTRATAPAARAATATRQVKAKYAGRCGRTGRRYPAGTMIEQTRYGWAIVGTDVDLSYQMDREDSAF